MDKLKAFVAKFWKETWPIVLLIVVVGVLVSFWFIPRDYSVATGSSEPCSHRQVSGERTPIPKNVAPVPLILENSAGVLIDFWRDRGTHWRTVFLQSAKRNPRQAQTKESARLHRQTFLAVSERPLERQELSGVIGPGQYVATAKVTGPKEVSLTVCVDATTFDVDPGTYVGSVRILGRAIQPVTVPVTVSLQYSGYRWVVPVLGVVTFLGGSFLVWASHKRASFTEGKGSIWRDIGELPGWIANNYVGVAGGVIAAISVFIAKYWRTAPWGASAPEDWFALLGGMFTAYTTTLTAATALVTPHRKDGLAVTEGAGGAEPAAAAPEAREAEGRRQPTPRPQ